MLVNNSEPRITTIISPTGKTQAPTNFASPGSVFTNVEPDIIFPAPPKAIKAPPKIPSNISLNKGFVALSTPTLII